MHGMAQQSKDIRSKDLKLKQITGRKIKHVESRHWESKLEFIEKFTKSGHRTVKTKGNQNKAKFKFEAKPKIGAKKSKTDAWQMKVL